MALTDWPKWIKLSVRDYFSSAVTKLLYVEGQERPSDDKRDQYELRFLDVRYRNSSSNYWQVELAINILIQHPVDNSWVSMDVLIGEIVNAMKDDIPIYDTDSVLLGCLKADSDIDVFNYGRVESTLRHEQATVERRYVLGVTSGSN